MDNSHPFDPLRSSAKKMGQSPGGKSDRDPNTTADAPELPERATPAEPPRSVEPPVGPIPNVPTPTAKPATGVPEYRYKPSTQHDSDVPVYTPKEK